ncbi:MAG: ribose-5-phosphate isomerase RpiA [Bryobacteraceae bacterium]
MSATNDELKRTAAHWAAAQLKDGMVVGLGSGSTASLAVTEIGCLLKTGLSIVGIPTSEATAEKARRLGIPLSTLGEHPDIDVAIDGADQVELGTLNLIKGGGGNLLREKLVAAASKRLVIVIDQGKLVDRLHRPVPVEIAQFGWQSTAKRLAALGSEPVARLASQGKMFVTDGGNFILDCAFGSIESAADLQARLDATVGVVEHGLFLGLTSQVAIGEPGGVRLL